MIKTTGTLKLFTLMMTTSIMNFLCLSLRVRHKTVLEVLKQSLTFPNLTPCKNSKPSFTNISIVQLQCKSFSSSSGVKAEGNWSVCDQPAVKKFMWISACILRHASPGRSVQKKSISHSQICFLVTGNKYRSNVF